jgi:hypothetical protein
LIDSSSIWYYYPKPKKLTTFAGMSLLLDRLLAQSQFRKMQVKKFQASVEEEEEEEEEEEIKFRKKKKERSSKE